MSPLYKNGFKVLLFHNLIFGVFLNQCNKVGFYHIAGSVVFSIG